MIDSEILKYFWIRVDIKSNAAESNNTAITIATRLT